MINVRVDTSDVEREETEAERVLRPGGKLARAIEHRLKEAALTSRMTHAYQNQTGHLQQGTAAYVESESDNETIFVLEQAEEYASYVAARGLNDFEEIAEAAIEDVGQIIESMIEDLANQ